MSELRPCACGCGRSVRSGDREYNALCRNPCKCGCGGRTPYAYIQEHRPERRGCSRCGKTQASLMYQDSELGELCSNCRRSVRGGGPQERAEHLVGKHQKQAQAPDGRRWCSGCEKYRACKFFGTVKDGDTVKYYSRCKPCKRKQGHATRIKKQYSITSEQYGEIKQYQGGTCAICLVATGASKALAVDHDHSCCPAGGSCGQCIRGLLCSRCNQMIGHGRDNPDFFRRAAEYIEDPPFRKMREEWGVDEG